MSAFPKVSCTSLLILASFIVLATMIIIASTARPRSPPRRGANADCKSRCQKNNSYGETCNQCCKNHPNGYMGTCYGTWKLQVCRCTKGKETGKPPRFWGMKLNYWKNPNNNS